MIISGSPDISSLAVRVTFDISGTTPSISLVNLSTGSHLQLCSWAFTAYSPSVTPIHLGDINDPDIDPSSSAWTTYVLSDTWPKNPYNSYQVEWSGAEYIFFVTVKDSIGNIYTTQYTNSQKVSIAPPPNLSQDYLSYFGIASSNVSVQCNNGAVFFMDNTDFTYQGSGGTKLSSTLLVSYPLDNTGSRQADFNLINYSSALVPVTINSPNYQFIQSSIYDYDYGNDTHVKIRYQLSGTFGVWCGINLLPLVAVLTKYFYKIATNGFSDMASAQKRGVLILFEYAMIETGILQPLAGACDIPEHIRNIENLTGFECFSECCNAQSGIIPQSGSSVIGGYNFIVNKLGGSISSASIFTTNGNNITLNIGDVTYIVDITANSPADITALKVTPQTTGDGFTKYYYLEIDGQTLATELVPIIKNNAEIYNAWLLLFGNTNSSFKVAVDGACIFTTTNACDFTFGLSNIPASTTYALLNSIKIGSTAQPLNFAFNLTNLSALQSYLNGVGYGIFIVTNLGSGNIRITSSTNTNNITALNYKVANTIYTADLTRACTGYEQKEAQEVLQNMIYWMCTQNDTQIVTSETYTICYIDAQGVRQTTVIDAGQDLSVFIASLLEAGCTTIDYLLTSGGGVNCTNMVSLFPATTQKVDANTLLYGNKIGCAGITAIELFQYMLSLTDTKTKQLFCDFVTSCGAGLACESISFNLLVTPSDTACSSIVGINYTLS